MISVNVLRNKDGMISALRVSGHSGTAEKGRDIVCAGVSALAQTAILGLGEHLHRDIDYSIDPGGDLQLRLKGDPDDLTQAVFETVRLGLAAISESCPRAVRITESRPGGESL